MQRGTVLFEVGGVQLELARRAMELAASKLPLPARFVVKGHS